MQSRQDARIEWVFFATLRLGVKFLCVTLNKKSGGSFRLCALGDVYKIGEQTIGGLDRSAGHAGFFGEDDRVIDDDIGAEGDAGA